MMARELYRGRQMVLRRITTSLRHVSTGVRDQNWTAIVIEFVLVVLGVFLGIAVANWNEERLEKRENDVLLRQVDKTLRDFLVFTGMFDRYYETAGAYGDRAIEAWKGDPSVSDEEFVIAAYQASQITGVGNNANVFGAIFGAENLRHIEDEEIRRSLAAIMTYDYALVDLRAVSTRYREEVRKTIPHSIQAAIRARCGDRQVGNGLVLPAHCDLKLIPEEAAQTAAALRARRDLLAELYWHRAAVANQLTNVDTLEVNMIAFTSRVGDPPPQANQQ